MDVTGRLLRFAARTPRALLVPVPGCPEVAMDVENALGRRGWPEATGPADADVLIVAGSPGPELAVVIDGVWQRMSAPRVRVDLADGRVDGDVERLLDQGSADLAGPGRARAEAVAAARSEHADHDEHADEHAVGGGHHDHGMDMALPGGLSMADVAEDRDGLALDVLHLPLGPVLPSWPAGLVVDIAMQGDVITSAEARVLDASVPRPPAPAVPPVVRELDTVARVLSVAGWPGPAARARDARDRLRSGRPVGDLAGLLRTIRRSRTLRLMVGRIAAGDGLDVADRLEERLARIESALGGALPEEIPRLRPADLGAHLVGAEFATARLLMAVLAPYVDDPVADGAAEMQERHR